MTEPDFVMCQRCKTYRVNDEFMTKICKYYVCQSCLPIVLEALERYATLIFSSDDNWSN